MTGGLTATGVEITSPPIPESKLFLLDALVLEGPDCNPDLSPVSFFDALVRVLPSFCISPNPLDRLGGALLFGAPLEIRFNGVSGVRVVCGAGGSEWPETL